MIFNLVAYPILMKRTSFLFGLLICSYTVFSHTAKEEFDYSIIFGGCFDKDIVSLKINNRSIFDHFKVDNKNAVKKGNLSLTQANNKISIFYNGQKKFKGYINFGFYLNIDVTVNQKMNRYKIDLRKGKVILIEFCPAENLQTKKKVSIEQIQEEIIFM